jgi:alkanesulfonate monooxygenase SsuD/methylene tetrahydromethanopterin reductase-like flavin-dependent oxidoreductase (luciferase family)
VEQLEEALQIIIPLWAGETVTFPGKYYRTDQATCDPVPVPPPPVMVGAFKPKMLRLTTKYADEWNVSSTGTRKYQRLVQEFEGVCREEGRDPSTVVRSWGGGCACMPTRAEAERIAGDRYSTANEEEDFGFVGTPKHIIQQMRRFIDLGVTAFYVDCGGFPNLITLELMVNEVLPAL